ncbi:MoaD/ThiS family protein [Trueperella pecoris]|uniref:MoaD/ThiS family protein n=1 Tax=Trueperella pecoris TaxID=2733571 RepID=A0A7M1QVR2_9ACTO|nr:MoaD/ThiS family protein [Trueperella pecoris]QOR45584.1 MoaD/ThiS family protein [Trueperella pecoris]
MISLRFFAAAADAAGTDTATFDLPAGSTLDDLVALIVSSRAAVAEGGTTPSAPGAAGVVVPGERGERLAHVLGLCSFLVNGKHAERSAVVPEGAAVDVLPPFAGG